MLLGRRVASGRDIAADRLPARTSNPMVRPSVRLHDTRPPCSVPGADSSSLIGREAYGAGELVVASENSQLCPLRSTIINTDR
jgi:hypothetical protein